MRPAALARVRFWHKADIRVASGRCPISGGGLKRSTQHFISDARDGVDSDGSKKCSRFQRGGQGGGVVDRWRRAFAVQPSDSAISTNGRARLWASKPEPNDLMLVLHRPIEPTAKSGHMQCSKRQLLDHPSARWRDGRRISIPRHFVPLAG